MFTSDITELFVKPSSRVIALLMFLSDKPEEFEWFFQHVYHLQFRNGTVDLCGLYDSHSYKYWFESPYHQIRHVEQIESIHREIDDLLEEQYTAIMYISTRKMQITTTKNYCHEILITGQSENHYYVCDFWPPNFVWEERLVHKYLVEHAAVFNNVPIGIIGLQRKIDTGVFNGSFTPAYYVRSYIGDKLMADSCHEKGYIMGKMVYKAFAESLSENLDIDIVIANFQICIDHAILWQRFVTMNDISSNELSVYIKKCMMLRNICIKARKQSIIPNIAYIQIGLRELENKEYQFMQQLLT